MSLYSELPQPKKSSVITEEALETRANAKPTQSSSLYSDLPNPSSTIPPTVSTTTFVTPPPSTTAPGWSAVTMFKPIIRKPTIQAKPKLNRPASISMSSGTQQQTQDQSAPHGPGGSVGANASTTSTDKLHQVKPVGLSEDVNGFKAVQLGFQKAPRKKKGKQKEGPAPLNPLEEYDPVRPNDYFEFKAAEQKRKEEVISEKKAARRKQKYGRSVSMSRSPSSSSRSRSGSYSSSKSRSGSRSRSPVSERDSRQYPSQFAPPTNFYSDDRPRSVHPTQAPEEPKSSLASAVISAESGEDAWMRRARLSGRVPIPRPRSPSPPPYQAAGPANPPAPGDAFAKRLMSKYGWQEGKGLGKSGDGIREALSVQQTGRGAGVIVNNGPALPIEPPKPPAQSPSINSVRSKVILLTNMVGPGEVDDQLQSETADECSKFGKVERCLVFELPNGKLPPEESVRIFVQFATEDSAEKAIAFLNRRYFGGRVVRATFFDQSRFERLDLAPSPSEMKS